MIFYSKLIWLKISLRNRIKGRKVVLAENRSCAVKLFPASSLAQTAFGGRFKVDFELDPKLSLFVFVVIAIMVKRP